jgi:hypothetical protein
MESKPQKSKKQRGCSDPTRKCWFESEIVCWQEWELARRTGQTSLSWPDWHKQKIADVRRRLAGRAQRIFRKRELPPVTGRGRTWLQDAINRKEFPAGFPLSDTKKKEGAATNA